MKRHFIVAMAYVVLAFPGCSDDEDDDSAAIVDPGPGPGPGPGPSPEPEPEPEPDPVPDPDPEPDPDPDPEPEPDPGHGWVIQRAIGYETVTLSAVDADHAWIGGPIDGVQATQDGGATWESRHAGGMCTKLQFLDLQNGWAFVAKGDYFNGELQSTSDGGKTWTTRLSGVMPYLSFVSPTTGWILGAEPGVLFKTTDGGQTWSESNLNSGLSAVHFTDAQNGWLASAGETTDSILRTADGGQTWQAREFATGPGRELRDIATVGSTHAWVLAASDEGSFLLATTDGGSSWKQVQITDGYIRAIHFADSKIGWAAGFDIHHTEDGGATWTVQILPPQEKLGLSPSNPFGGFYDIEFIDAKTGWAVADNGVTLKTTNGGK